MVKSPGAQDEDLNWNPSTLLGISKLPVSLATKDPWASIQTHAHTLTEIYLHTHKISLQKVARSLGNGLGL